jgi:hypothetical protein
MPIRRRRVFKRKPRAARRGRKAPMRGIQRAIRALRPELKYSDNFGIDSSASNGSTFSSQWLGTAQGIQDYAFGDGTAGPVYSRTFCLNSLDQGIGKDQRIGWKVRNKFVDVRLKLMTLQAASTDPAIPLALARWRVMLLMQKDYSGVFQANAPVPQDILQQGVFSAGGDAPLVSHLLDRYKDRFAVLHDKIYTPDTTKGAWINTRLRKRLRAVSQYSSNGALTVGAQNQTHGALYMIIMFAQDTSDGSPTSQVGHVDFTSRFYFTDS